MVGVGKNGVGGTGGLEDSAHVVRSIAFHACDENWHRATAGRSWHRPGDEAIAGVGAELDEGGEAIRNGNGVKGNLRIGGWGDSARDDDIDRDGGGNRRVSGAGGDNGDRGVLSDGGSGEQALGVDRAARSGCDGPSNGVATGSELQGLSGTNVGGLWRNSEGGWRHRAVVRRTAHETENQRERAREREFSTREHRFAKSGHFPEGRILGNT